jgi:DNA-binding CsgD family transcriptional regulator
MRTGGDFGLNTKLTDAERGIAVLLLRGLPYNVIAEVRGTSVRTVANQTAEIYRKTGTSSRAELAARVFPVSAVLCCPGAAHRALPELTAHELVAAYWVARGATNKWVAYELGISESTAANHLRRAKAKLGLVNRVDFVRAVYERGALGLRLCTDCAPVPIRHEEWLA